jgi:hypothetical protein
MSNKEERPKLGTKEHREWMRKKMEKRWEEIIAAGPADFEDECGVISGSVKTLFATDAELFPDELEEYTPEELEAYYAKLAQKPKE